MGLRGVPLSALSSAPYKSHCCNRDSVAAALHRWYQAMLVQDRVYLILWFEILRKHQENR